MATAPALPQLSDLPAMQPAIPQPAQPHQPTVIRTQLHTVSTGVGARTARRQIVPAAGFALEVLGHAIEYLADEYVHASGSISSLHSGDPRVEAMQLLMAANREVYYACPLMPSLYQRVARRLFNR